MRRCHRQSPSARAAVLAACFVLVATASGCGGGEPAPARHPTSRYTDPTPDERVGDVVSRVEGAATASRCTPVKGLLHSAYGTIGDASCRSVKGQLGAFQDPVARSYGTGAVIDYNAVTGEQRVMALALDSDRKFRVAFVEDTASSSIGTPKPPQFDVAASTVVVAMQTGDCDTFLRYVDRRMGLGTGTDEQVCRRITDDPFRRELVANRSARPVPLGGNSQIAFYKVRTTPVRYYTMIMARQPGGGGDPARFVLVNAFPA